MRSRMWRFLEAIGGMVLLLLALSWLSGGCEEQVPPGRVTLPEPGAEEAGERVRVEDRVGESVEWTSGEIASARHTVVSSRVLARIEEVRVAAGSRVEAGDVLFVLVFAIALVREKEPSVSVDTLASSVYSKIVRRHPHVFGDAVARTENESLAHWDRVKAEEKEPDAPPFEGVAGNLPPMRLADKVQRLAARSGFDWPDTTGIFEKIEEEIREVKDAVARMQADAHGDDHTAAKPAGSGNSIDRLREEIGDLFFSVINLSRFLNIDGEAALAQANAKFIARYRAIEALAEADGHRLEDLTLEQMDVYWERTKKTER